MVQMVLNVRSLEHYWCNVLPLLGVSLWLCRHWSERVIFSDKVGRMNFHSHGMFHCHYYFSRDFQADIIISHNTKDLSSRLGSLVCDDRWFGLWDIAERGRERERKRGKADTITREFLTYTCHFVTSVLLGFIPHRCGILESDWTEGVNVL